MERGGRGEEDFCRLSGGRVVEVGLTDRMWENGNSFKEKMCGLVEWGRKKLEVYVF